MTSIAVRFAGLAATLGIVAAWVAPASAQQWAPTQPIRVIIPYAAGGTSDIIARTMSDHVSQRLGQPLLLENRGGGATQIGTSAVAKAPPDGHTLLLVANTFMINPSLFRTLPYDSLKDITPITYAGVTPHTIVVNPDVPAKNLKDLLDLAKAKPGAINYGSVGIGTSFHLGTEELKKLSGTDMVHVPYKGMGQVLTDLVSGNIQMAFAHPKRVPQLPDIPTVGEQGFPGFESNSGFIYFAPGGTPPAVLDRLNTVFVEVLNLPEVKEALTRQGVEVMATSRADTADFIRKEMKRYAEVVAFSGAKAE
jgi:tripartite-type tricarboxylate transporter receptor subunit TctC